MPYHISKKTINKVTRCIYNFKCLNDDNFQICHLEKPINNTVHFIKYLKPIRNSDYCLSFGSSYICNCLIRLELYERYKV